MSADSWILVASTTARLRAPRAEGGGPGVAVCFVRRKEQDTTGKGLKRAGAAVARTASVLTGAQSERPRTTKSARQPPVASPTPTPTDEWGVCLSPPRRRGSPLYHPLPFPLLLSLFLKLTPAQSREYINRGCVTWCEIMTFVIENYLGEGSCTLASQVGDIAQMNQVSGI